MVARLEKPLRSSVEFAGGREVIQYRGDVLPLVNLRDVFGFAGPSTEEPSDEMQVVVYSDGGRSCGIVVDRIVDIVETELKFATARPADDVLLGTTVIQQRVTDVLNLPNLAKRDATFGSRFCDSRQGCRDENADLPRFREPRGTCSEPGEIDFRQEGENRRVAR
jgi:chemotaxis protein histidine kinase CheA